MKSLCGINSIPHADCYHVDTVADFRGPRGAGPQWMDLAYLLTGTSGVGYF